MSGEEADNVGTTAAVSAALETAVTGWRLWGRVFRAEYRPQAVRIKVVHALRAREWAISGGRGVKPLLHGHEKGRLG